MLPIEPGQTATVLVALAGMEGMPSQMSVGNEMRVPPATLLIAPATAAAAKMSRLSTRLKDTTSSPSWSS
jgi:hypothetical protein